MVVTLSVSASVSALLLLTCLLSLLVLLTSRRKRVVPHFPLTATPQNLAPPGPVPWPVIGDLHLLGKHPNPFVAFTALSKVYGDIFGLTLGSVRCVVVNNFPLIKEVLISKGSHFGGRPDFIRFHKLFGGDRNNSLALCDWSSLQRTRRSIARTYCSPRLASDNYALLDRVARAETGHFLAALRACEPLARIKPLVMAACANMFTQYMCSTRFAYEDPAFARVVRSFDDIFWDINNGYAVDFLPWLLPFYTRHMNKLTSWAKEIRQFICSRIVEEHQKTLNYEAPPRDFTDALLIHLEQDPDLKWDHAIYELEDFLGGHSAVGNLVMLALAAVLRHPHVGDRIRMEVDAVTKGQREISLCDRQDMPYTEAVLLEVLRTASSPIVPHVATENTTVGGYNVDKGTLVFLNNYELNLGESYWTDPDQFRPERFISAENQVVKPHHFIPFSTGKRTCIGQRLVQSFSFTLIASLLSNFDITADLESVQTVPACVALPPDTFAITLTPRHRHGE